MAIVPIDSNTVSTQTPTTWSYTPIDPKTGLPIGQTSAPTNMSYSGNMNPIGMDPATMQAYQAAMNYLQANSPSLSTTTGVGGSSTGLYTTGQLSSYGPLSGYDTGKARATNLNYSPQEQQFIRDYIGRITSDPYGQNVVQPNETKMFNWLTGGNVRYEPQGRLSDGTLLPASWNGTIPNASAPGGFSTISTLVKNADGTYTRNYGNLTGFIDSTFGGQGVAPTAPAPTSTFTPGTGTSTQLPAEPTVNTSQTTGTGGTYTDNTGEVPGTPAAGDSSTRNYAPQTEDYIRGQIYGNLDWLMKNQPTPKYYEGPTYAGLTQDQITAQNLAKNYATQFLPGFNQAYASGIDKLMQTPQGMDTAGTAFSDAQKAASTAMQGYTAPNITAQGIPMHSNITGTLENQMSGNVDPFNSILDQALGSASRQYGNMVNNATASYARDVMPQVQAAQDLARRSADDFLTQVAPELRSSSQFAGQYGGSRQGIAEGLAASRIGEEVARQTGNLASQANLGAGALGQYLANQAGNVGESMGQTAAGTAENAYNTAQNRALSAAGTAGQYGLGAQQQGLTAQGMQADAATQYMNTLLNAQSGAGNQAYNFANLYGNNLGTGLQNAPTLAKYNYMPTDIYSNVGAQNQQINQLGITDKVNAYNYNQMAPWNNTMQAASLFQTTPIATQFAPQPSYSTNPMMAGLGGAAMGYGIGGPWGAAAGGLLGFGSAQGWF